MLWLHSLLPTFLAGFVLALPPKGFDSPSESKVTECNDSDCYCTEFFADWAIKTRAHYHIYGTWPLVQSTGAQFLNGLKSATFKCVDTRFVGRSILPGGDVRMRGSYDLTCAPGLVVALERKHTYKSNTDQIARCVVPIRPRQVEISAGETNCIDVIPEKSSMNLIAIVTDSLSPYNKLVRASEFSWTTLNNDEPSTLCSTDHHTCAIRNVSSKLTYRICATAYAAGQNIWLYSFETDFSV